METTEHKAKSVIRVWLIFLGLGICFSVNGFAQKKDPLTPEQYEIINSRYKYSKKETIVFAKKTFAYEPWMDLLYEKEFNDLEVIGYCTPEETKFKDALSKFIEVIKTIEAKKIDPSSLDPKIKLKRRAKKEVLEMAEPVIVGDYSFQFFKLSRDKVLSIQKKDLDGQWEYECSIFLVAFLH